MKKTKKNYYIILMNIFAVLAYILFYIYGLEIAESTRIVNGQAVNLFNNKIMIFFLVNIQVLMIVFCLGVSITNIINAILNWKNKKLFFWQISFSLVFIYLLISNNILKIIMFFVLPIIFSIKNIILIKKNHPNKINIISYILTLVITILLFIVMKKLDINYSNIVFLWIVVSIIMQIIYTHKQTENSNKKIFIIFINILATIFSLTFLFLICYSILVNRAGKKELENIRLKIDKEIVSLNCTSTLRYIPVLKDNKYGFIDINGKEVIEPQFDIVSFFVTKKINNINYCFSFAKLNNDYYLVSKENKKIKIDNYKIIDNYSNFSKDFQEAVLETADYEPIGEIYAFYSLMAIFFEGDFQIDNLGVPYNENILKLQKNDDSYILENENYTMKIRPLDEQYQFYTKCNLIITKNNGETQSYGEEIYCLDEYANNIEPYSDGYIGFRSIDQQIYGWYDNYGNKVSVNFGDFEIFDVKKDYMILKNTSKENECNYCFFDMSGKELLSTKYLSQISNIYIITNKDEKMILIDEDLNVISNEYDKILI